MSKEMCDCCDFEQEDLDTFDFNGDKLCSDCHQYAKKKLKEIHNAKDN